MIIQLNTNQYINVKLSKAVEAEELHVKWYGIFRRYIVLSGITSGGDKIDNLVIVYISILVCYKP